MPEFADFCHSAFHKEEGMALSAGAEREKREWDFRSFAFPRHTRILGMELGRSAWVGLSAISSRSLAIRPLGRVAGTAPSAPTRMGHSGPQLDGQAG